LRPAEAARVAGDALALADRKQDRVLAAAARRLLTGGRAGAVAGPVAAGVGQPSWSST
jgi:hypothetical protein